jgi:hypothetical protein
VAVTVKVGAGAGFAGTEKTATHAATARRKEPLSGIRLLQWLPDPVLPD